MPNLAQPPVRTPLPLRRPQLPPAHWAVIDAYIAEHLPHWPA